MFKITKLPDVVEIKPPCFQDDRGYFIESFNKKKFNDYFGNIEFVQDNHSFSHKGVLRGIHFQNSPFQQGKLVRVIQGKVFDVAVDLRKNSKSFGEWVGVTLSEQEQNQLWIPEGFGHAFLTLSETAHFVYKTTNFYNKNSEVTISWDDSDIGIDWPELNEGKINLSEKDIQGISLKMFLK
jgi:dTDP-4-dehydrorhamnose 3,5-epimerase